MSASIISRGKVILLQTAQSNSNKNSSQSSFATFHKSWPLSCTSKNVQQVFVLKIISAIKNCHIIHAKVVMSLQKNALGQAKKCLYVSVHLLVHKREISVTLLARYIYLSFSFANRTLVFRHWPCQKLRATKTLPNRSLEKMTVENLRLISFRPNSSGMRLKIEERCMLQRQRLSAAYFATHHSTWQAPKLRSPEAPKLRDTFERPLDTVSFVAISLFCMEIASRIYNLI